MSTSFSRSPSLPGDNQPHRRPQHTYHSHRRASFIAHDIPEQVEIRARLRTFEGAYSRTALASLGYSVLVLKLFDRRFYRIGLLYVILSLLLLLVQFQRRRHARHDFADQFRDLSDPSEPPSPGRTPAAIEREAGTSAPSAPSAVDGTQVGQGQGGKKERVWGREFKTAGWSVVLVTVIVGTVEIALFGLVCAL
ncbi:hypothetical protein CALVIDRAFT_504293 [Calocera viscosa TUFC12733]|uniref:DUF202 domain-containing protein n=1 Tax=Calocera viscosa (strain TUFC12733) TaxID=1330018 RepID=A0A167IB12_CALVF|nr:hypothetical protein CALVIDRAFT_504293 [Calocera viscosa TUFC12733]